MPTPPTIDRLRRFRALARDFREAAERGDASALERILGARRRLVSDLEAAGPPRDERESATRTRLLEAILEIDRGAEEILSRRRDEIGAELVALDSGRRGLAGYGGSPRKAGKRIDERG